MCLITLATLATSLHPSKLSTDHVTPQDWVLITSPLKTEYWSPHPSKLGSDHLTPRDWVLITSSLKTYTSELLYLTLTGRLHMWREAVLLRWVVCWGELPASVCVICRHYFRTANSSYEILVIRHYTITWWHYCITLLPYYLIIILPYYCMYNLLLTAVNNALLSVSPQLVWRAWTGALDDRQINGQYFD